MNKKRNNGTMLLFTAYTISLMFLLFLVGMKIHRAAPISWEVIACVGALLLIPPVVVELADVVLDKLLRCRKVKRRIIRQAKAAGVWDNLNALGGRALELKAWEAYKIKRKSGETDVCLRIRCKEKEFDEYKKKTQKKIAAALAVPVDILVQEDNRKTQEGRAE